jgi:glutamyl-tRNA synthetase
MINNPAGKKLSKRDGAMDVMEYKRLGYLPEALLNFLVRLGWSHGDQEIFSMEELLELFDPSDINKSASAYNEEKLLWLNAHYIKESSNDKLKDLLKFYGLDISDYKNKDAILTLCKDRSNTMIELKDGVEMILNAPSEYNAKGAKKFVKENTFDMLEKYMALLETNKDTLNSVEDIENLTKPFIVDNELKFPQLFQPIRLSLTGGTNAPSVYDMIAIIGVDETNTRIQTAIKVNFGKEI